MSFFLYKNLISFFKLGPIRPLVNFTSAPTYKLAKKVEQIIKSNLHLEKSYSLKNTFDFIEKLKEINIKYHHTMASFDIENLYTNIPIEKTIDLLKQHLIDNSGMNPAAIDELITLTREILKQNYFMFDGAYYIQEEGLAMGSPLSGIMAELYLNYVENDLIFSGTNKFKDKILFYSRFVDDTFIIFNGNHRQLKLLNSFLNNLTPTLNFTLEIEKDKMINFLDLTVIKRTNNIEFSIYRKPTMTSQTIHATSHHPQSQKMAAYNSFVHRLINIPLTEENYIKELCIIKQIAISNGFTAEMIDKLVKKYVKQTRSKISNTNDIKYTSIEYNDNLHNVLKKELKNEGITLSFKTSNNLSKLTKPPRQQSNKYNSTGVYKITCSDCPCHYYGQTGRSFKIRMAEHLPKPNMIEQKSSFAHHLIDKNHKFTSIDENMDILHICQKSRKMDVLEEFEVFRGFKTSPDTILNDKIHFSSNAIFNTMLGLKQDGQGRDGLDGSDNQLSAVRQENARIPPEPSNTGPVRRTSPAGTALLSSL